jgi:RNA polymerase sigma-70 factor (ECF subfamily)
MRAVGSSTGRAAAGDVRMGDRAAASFEEFFEQERVRLYRVLFAITGSRHEAEDISQDAFLRVWERWDRVAAMDEPSGYLHRVATNVFRDRRRRLMLGMRRAVRLAPPPDHLEAVETRTVASGLLASLTPRQRAAVVLTEALGYSADEAGALLGIKGSTVRALTYQARSSVQESMERADG